MAEWIAFLAVAGLAVYASIGAAVLLLVGTCLSEGRGGWLLCLIPALIAALLIYVAIDIAPFTVRVVSHG